MENRMFAVSLLILSALCASCAKADNHPREKQSITEDSVNLSAKRFLEAFASQDVEIRRASRLYLLGVLDASEGKSWCGYAVLKTASINDFIFDALRKMPSEKLDRRASEVIEEQLGQVFPCKGQP